MSESNLFWSFSKAYFLSIYMSLESMGIFTISLDSFLTELDRVSSRFLTPQYSVLFESYQNLPHSSLFDFSPWRKGPFQLGDVFVDSEWDSSLKWNRIKSYLSSANIVLDVGCGNGYYLFELCRDFNPSVCVGIDPTVLFFIQFQVVQFFYQNSLIQFLPFGFQELTCFASVFDHVLCMGVLYHHKDPVSVLSSLFSVIKEGGTLILETLVLNSQEDTVLCPSFTYAGMKNVHHVPSLFVLSQWISQAGFSEHICVDVTYTSPITEQRVTSFSSSKSLIDVLNSSDFSSTIEGYPAPCRAVFVVKK